MNRRTLMITAISLMICLAAGVGIASAYFTDYEAAKGGAVLRLSGRTEIEEKFDGNDKIVKIMNTGDADMLVRIMAYGDESRMTFNSAENGDWVRGASDNMWYYGKVLKAGESTSELRIAVDGEIKAEDPIDFDITVVHEAARVTYTKNADGEEVAAAPDGWENFPAVIAEE